MVKKNEPIKDVEYTRWVHRTLETNDNGEIINKTNPKPTQDIDGSNRTSLNTVFGEKQIGVRKADIAAQFQYGIRTGRANITQENGGTLSFSESLLIVSTGTNIAGKAAVSNKKALRYLPGHEAYMVFTAVFSDGKANSHQRGGLFDSKNGFFIGFEGTQFSTTRRRNEVDYSNDIDITKVFDDGSFDPTKGNVYRISFGYLGFATINFEVLQPNGGWKSLSKIEYPNSKEVTHITNTNLQPRIEAENTGNNTDIIVKTGSFSAGIINGGGTDPASRRFTFDSTAQSVVAGTYMVFTFRNKSEFNSLVNYIQSTLTFLSFNTDLSKSSLWELRKNMTITNTPDWTDINTDDSIIEYSSNVVVTAGTGSLEFSVPLGKIDRVLIDCLECQDIELLPGETMTLLLITPSGTNGTYDLSFRWKELF